MLGEDHDKTRKYLPRHVCHAQAFCLPVYPAVLLCKLTNNYKTFLSLSSEKNASRQVYKRIEIRVFKVNMSSNRVYTYDGVIASGLQCGNAEKS